MIVIVEIGVALARPPRVDRISQVTVVAEDETDAMLVATHMAMRPDVIMPVSARIIDILEI